MRDEWSGAQSIARALNQWRLSPGPGAHLERGQAAHVHRRSSQHPGRGRPERPPAEPVLGPFWRPESGEAWQGLFLARAVSSRPTGLARVPRGSRTIGLSAGRKVISLRWAIMMMISSCHLEDSEDTGGLDRPIGGPGKGKGEVEVEVEVERGRGRGRGKNSFHLAGRGASLKPAWPHSSRQLNSSRARRRARWPVGRPTWRLGALLNSRSRLAAATSAAGRPTDRSPAGLPEWSCQSGGDVREARARPARFFGIHEKKRAGKCKETTRPSQLGGPRRRLAGRPAG